MISEDGEWFLCNEPGCPEKFKLNHWTKIKSGALWFFSRNNIDGWCQNHHPAWVAEWRKKRSG